MLITIENFGPIRRVEFDLTKDLSVVFGKNNIGKSYAITAVYLLLKVLREAVGDQNANPFFTLLGQRVRYNRHVSADPRFQQIGAAIRARLNAAPDEADVLITAEMTDLLRENLTVLEEPLTDAFASSFPPIGELSNWWQHQPFVITLRLPSVLLELRADGASIRVANVTLLVPIWAFQTPDTPEKRDEILSEGGMLIGFASDSEYREDLGRSDPDEFCCSSALMGLQRRFGREVRRFAQTSIYLPASRSGLYPTLTAIAPMLAELSKSRHLLRGTITLPRLTRPVADYFLHLSLLNASVSSSAVAVLGAEMEQQLLGGEVSFNDQTKELQFTQARRAQPLELTFTSSMISELAPIVAFLKYVLPALTPVSQEVQIEPDGPSLLFIEEPEAHLHPEVQVKLLEFFARLTKHNVKVVMTTHSNYMFNKLSNLLLTGEMAPENVGSYLMVNTPEGSIVAPDAMTAEAEGIADENFADVAEKLYHERLQAYDAQADAQANRPPR